MVTLIITATFPQIGRNTNFIFSDLWAKFLSSIQNLFIAFFEKGEVNFSITKYENNID
jgi:hypothetical protein